LFFLIAGLGNPGEAYRASRHNVGFEAVDRLAARHSIAWTARRFSGIWGQGRIADQTTGLIKPQTYMNLSGEAVAQAARFLGIEPPRLAVVHDDLDLEFGRIQVRQGGGDGGHRGVRSVIEHLGSADFVRLRLGIGRPPADADTVEHVLSAFAAGDEEILAGQLERCADAIETWMAAGLSTSMNRFNTWRRSKPSKERKPDPGAPDKPEPETIEG
jgi:PTH1 family peptidyl-tRNA hydrolase